MVAPGDRGPILGSLLLVKSASSFALDGWVQIGLAVALIRLRSCDQRSGCPPVQAVGGR